MHPDLANAFLRWALLRSALARGWWLATAVYLVVVAELSPFQLVLIGVFQGVTVVMAEIPAGVLADAVSRRLALVLAHVVMGAGMATTGFVASFPLLVVSNCLWGLGWALSSGADVAWITDELDRPDLIDRVLAAQEGRALVGGAIGIIGFGALAWATTLSSAIVAAGLAMIALGLLVVARWPETRFAPVDVGRRWAETRAILRRGARVARSDRVILLVLIATLFINGAHEGFGRLFERRLVRLGMPTEPDPIVWFAAVSAACCRIRHDHASDRRGAHRRCWCRPARLRHRVRDRCRRPVRVRPCAERSLGGCGLAPRVRHRIPDHKSCWNDPRQPAHVERRARDGPLVPVASREHW